MTTQATRRTHTQPTVSLVTDIRVRNWGRDIELDCLDDPLTRRSYEFVFANCRDVHWSLEETDVDQNVCEADIIGFSLGQGQYRETAMLTTDLFELSVLYDRLEIRALSSDAGHERRAVAAAGD